MEEQRKTSQKARSLAGLASAADRRAQLLSQMDKGIAAGNTCFACTGVCCTFIANSMQVTPIELRDILQLLWQRGEFTRDLRTRLEECVRRYRLDVDVGDGRRSLRKTYTCPFYSPGPRGCGLSRTHKPYGCLAFNAHQPGVTEGQDCGSDQTLLSDREQAFPEEVGANHQLRELWQLHWEKSPLPCALLEVWDRVQESHLF